LERNTSLLLTEYSAVYTAYLNQWDMTQKMHHMSVLIGSLTVT